MNDSYDSLIVLGKNWEKDDSSESGYKPSIATHVLALAAAELYKAGHIKKIILSGGDTLCIQKSEAEAMKEIIQENYKIPDPAFLLEEESLDTIENAKFSKKILQENNLSNPLILTTGYQLARAKEIFHKTFKKDIPAIAGEEILLKYNTKYKKLLDEFKSSDFVKLDSSREPFANVLLEIDPNGKIEKQISHTFRGCSIFHYKK
ncbi:YdcF family protein [Candidatus Pacearchaeota archaeon]|nr:YdcF family protein [Candidatus Pacearchaeota archaeon]